MGVGWKWKLLEGGRDGLDGKQVQMALRPTQKLAKGHSSMRHRLLPQGGVTERQTHGAGETLTCRG